jgi:hypothetical protein
MASGSFDKEEKKWKDHELQFSIAMGNYDRIRLSLDGDDRSTPWIPFSWCGILR